MQEKDGQVQSADVAVPPKMGDYALQAKSPKEAGYVALQPPETSYKEGLHKGIDLYIQGHPKKVESYKEKYQIKSSEPVKPTYFRDQFYAFINELEQNKKPIPDGTMEQHNGPVKMEELFALQSDPKSGMQYAELYELALEEEMNSREFMNAVLHESTEVYAGDKWAERPIVFVAGPSASGKSYAANAAISQASRFLSKEANPDKAANQVISVDGGVARKVSQVRKLALKAANNQGYSGIADLNAHSQVLRKVKHRVYDHAVNHTKAGIVIPETFSAFMNPLGKSKKMLQRAFAVPNSKTIFARTEGKDQSIFQKVVNFMGSSRAWKSGKVEYQNLAALNAGTDKESKAYGAGGFRWGVLGSKLAEDWFKKNSKKNLSMIIVNDLILLKESPPKSNTYVAAMPGDQGALMISERVYNEWLVKNKVLKDIGQPPLLLTEEYIKNNRVDSIIQTSAEIKVEIAKVKIEKLVERYSSDYHKEWEQHRFVEPLNEISKSISRANLRDLTEISALQTQVDNLRALCKKDNILAVFTSDTLKRLNQLSKALGSVADDLRLEKQVSENIKSQQNPEPATLTDGQHKQAISEPTASTLAEPDQMIASQDVAIEKNAEPAAVATGEWTELRDIVIQAANRSIAIHNASSSRLTSHDDTIIKNANELIKMVNASETRTPSALKDEIYSCLTAMDSGNTYLKSCVDRAFMIYELSVAKNIVGNAKHPETVSNQTASNNSSDETPSLPAFRH